MSLPPESISPTVLGKRLLENGGCSSVHSKLKNSDVVQHLPVNCGTPGDGKDQSDKMHLNGNAERNIVKNLHAIVGNKSASSVEDPKVGNARCSDDAKCSAAIPALPLRRAPTVNVQLDHKNSLANHSDGQKSSNDNENKVGSGKASWKSDLEKLNALIAQAKGYIHMCNSKHALQEVPSKESKGFDLPNSCDATVLHDDPPTGEPKPLAETNQHEETAADRVLLVDSVTRQNSDESLPENMMTVRDRISKVSEGKKPSTLEIKMGDDDEVCVLSPEEWKTLQQRSSHRSDCNVVVEYNGIVDEEADDSSNVLTCIMNQNELINLSIVPHDHPQALKTRTILQQFEKEYAELIKELGEPGVTKGTNPHLMAAARLNKKGMCLVAERPFGHIPGVQIGDEFWFRSELAVVGLHSQLIADIDHVLVDGKKFATSVVSSGYYENEAKAIDVLIYSGQGGNENTPRNAGDQKLEKGNLALKNSMEMQYPVRVTYKRKSLVASSASGLSDEGNFVYVYDGLYTVNRMRQERDQNGKLVFKFYLQRMSGQPRVYQTHVKPRKPAKSNEVCIVDDISQGKESLPIRAMNGLDDVKYPSFTYITKMVYPTWYRQIEPIGCNCTDGCSDSQKCPCLIRNDGEIPFNEKGKLIRARPLVYECGPLCKCPPSCMNRVCQHGPQYQLEVFKTTTRGWGVRSITAISCGSFICEYIGQMLQDKEAEQRINDDEYLFDLGEDGEEGEKGEFQSFLGSKSTDDCFAIDSAKFGNIGRFINHSCSPNLFAQRVFYDHADKRMPHIMFFATKYIPPLKELSYDYNYKVDRVCDANGNVKTKACYCGSSKCTGRMY